MSSILYIIWALIPLVLFLMALWSYLEKVAGKKRQERPEDLAKQGLFTSVCVGLSIIIDIYVLPSAKETILTEYIPYPAFQVILFPAVLYITAKLLGPTKDILISKAPETSKAYRKK